MKKQILISVSVLVLILLIGSVNADFWACFNKGDRINFCNSAIPDRTSPSNKYSICMSNYDEAEKCYSSGNPSQCNEHAICTYSGDATLDAEPPTMIIDNPQNGVWYNSKSMLVKINTNEKAYLYFYDNIYGRRWTRICNGCSAYSSKKSFKEGFNNITFRASDVVGNEANETKTFFIDSIRPIIHRTQPRSGYASGFFEVEYTEYNLDSMKMTYGNEESGIRTETLECDSGKKQWCNISVDLSDYNSEKIMYYFTAEDIAGNERTSQKKQNMNVDTVSPILNNPDSYWEQGEGRDSRYIYFSFNVTEENLDKITYSYLDSRKRIRETNLCSRLKTENREDITGICEVKKMFSKGDWKIDINIKDKAGNSVEKHIEFEV